MSHDYLQSLIVLMMDARVQIQAKEAIGFG
jgi:hypothetical protein